MTLCGSKLKGEGVRGNREREQGAYLGHASAAAAPALGCAPPVRRRRPERERERERGEGKEIGR